MKKPCTALLDVPNDFQVQMLFRQAMWGTTGRDDVT